MIKSAFPAFTPLLLLTLAVACGDDRKKETGELCDNHADCADVVCHRGGCMAALPDGAGAPCTSPWECKSLSCAAGACGPGDRADGEACLYNEECRSHRCADGACAASDVDAGSDGAPPDAGPDAPPPDLATDAAPPDHSPDKAPHDLPAPDVGYCGDGVVNGTEACDPAASSTLNAQCTDFGYTNGLPSCPKCKWVLKDCFAALDGTGFAVSSVATTTESLPAVASDGTDWLVAYLSTTSSATNLHARRVSAAGKVLDATAIDLGDAKSAQLPAVTWTGSKYLVLWRSGYGLKTALVDPQGNKTLRGTVLTNVSPGPLRAATLGSNTLAVWATGGHNVYGSRVTAGGLALDVIHIGVGTYYETAPYVGTDGKEWFVTWTDGRSSSKYQIYGSRVTTGGAMKDSGGNKLTTVTSNKHSSSAVIYDKPSSRYLVAWNRESGSTHHLEGLLVDPQTGKPDTSATVVSMYKGSYAHTYNVPASNSSDVMMIAYSNSKVMLMRLKPPQVELALPDLLTAASVEYQPTLAWGKSHYLAVWMDKRNGSSDIHAARVK